MKPSRRYHPYGCKRDKEYVGSLGRMTDAEYNAFGEKHNIATHRAIVVERDKISRISNEEYKELQAEANLLKKVLGSARKGEKKK